jgi:predicted ATPase
LSSPPHACACSPIEIAARLEDRFALLTSGTRTAPERQQTLEATINWSYDLLPVDERRLFEDSSVFVDGFSLAGLTPAAGAGHESDVLDLLGRLVDRSLVVVDPPRAGAAQSRYGLLESLRAFAWQRLVARGDAEQVQLRMADWLIEMAEQADAAFHGPDQGHWLVWAETERGNARAVLLWLLERQNTEGVLRLVTSVWWSWIHRGRRQESQAVFEQCVALPGASAHQRLWGRLLVGAGMFGIIGGGGDQSVARARLEEALRIGLEVGDS